MKRYPVWIRVVVGVRVHIDAESPEEAAERATNVDFGEVLNRDIHQDVTGSGESIEHVQYDDGAEHKGILVDVGDDREVAWDAGDTDFKKRVAYDIETGAATNTEGLSPDALFAEPKPQTWADYSEPSEKTELKEGKPIWHGPFTGRWSCKESNLSNLPKPETKKPGST